MTVFHNESMSWLKNKRVRGKDLSDVISTFVESVSSGVCLFGCIRVGRQRLDLRTGSQCRHEELHLVDKVSSLHLAPVHLFVWPPEMAPLAVLDGVALRQLFGLAAGELD